MTLVRARGRPCGRDVTASPSVVWGERGIVVISRHGEGCRGVGDPGGANLLSQRDPIRAIREVWSGSSELSQLTALHRLIPDTRSCKSISAQSNSLIHYQAQTHTIGFMGPAVLAKDVSDEVVWFVLLCYIDRISAVNHLRWDEALQYRRCPHWPSVAQLWLIKLCRRPSWIQLMML